MRCMSQNFRLFHVSNLSVRNFRIFLLMYTASPSTRERRQSGGRAEYYMRQFAPRIERRPLLSARHTQALPARPHPSRQHCTEIQRTAVPRRQAMFSNSRTALHRPAAARHRGPGVESRSMLTLNSLRTVSCVHWTLRPHAGPCPSRQLFNEAISGKIFQAASSIRLFMFFSSRKPFQATDPHQTCRAKRRRSEGAQNGGIIQLHRLHRKSISQTEIGQS